MDARQLEKGENARVEHLLRVALATVRIYDHTDALVARIVFYDDDRSETPTELHNGASLVTVLLTTRLDRVVDDGQPIRSLFL